jgi:hypothetical protein
MGDIIWPPNNDLAKALGEPIYCLNCDYKLSGKKGNSDVFCSLGCQARYYDKWIKENRKRDQIPKP